MNLLSSLKGEKIGPAGVRVVCAGTECDGLGWSTYGIRHIEGPNSVRLPDGQRPMMFSEPSTPIGIYSLTALPCGATTCSLEDRVQAFIAKLNRLGSSRFSVSEIPGGYVVSTEPENFDVVAGKALPDHCKYETAGSPECPGVRGAAGLRQIPLGPLYDSLSERCWHRRKIDFVFSRHAIQVRWDGEKASSAFPPQLPGARKPTQSVTPGVGDIFVLAYVGKECETGTKTVIPTGHGIEQHLKSLGIDLGERLQ